MYTDLRRRINELDDDLDRLDGTNVASARALFQVTTSGNFPTSLPAFFACHPVLLNGTEAEGATPALTPDSTRVEIVLVIGRRLPVLGDYLDAKIVNGRWVAERSTSVDPNHIGLYGCPCSDIPTTLTMTSANPTCDNRLFQPTTLVYGTTPTALLPLGLGAKSFLSPGSFTDYATGDSFQYFFTCYIGAYVLGRAYAHSVHGSPYLDFYRYYWLVGFPGNYCSGEGVAPAAAATVAGGAVTAVTVTAPGTYISSISSVSISGGGGTGATATVKVVGNSVASVTVTNGGAGYITPPAVTFNGIVYLSTAPFLLSNGHVYSGGDPTCNVTISG